MTNETNVNKGNKGISFYRFGKSISDFLNWRGYKNEEYQMKIVDKSINFVSAGKNKSIHTCIHLYIFTPNFPGKTNPSLGTFSLNQRSY